MDERDKIIVFRYFDSAIDANIVKTKLDAYEIPCFLTEENLSNLYPGVGFSMSAFRVRLHLFSQDAERATKILEADQPIELDPDSITKCPRCGSQKIERDFARNPSQNLLRLLVGLLVGLVSFVFFPAKRVYRCQDCEHEFN
jgi:hypothetical protein